MAGPRAAERDCADSFDHDGTFFNDVTHKYVLERLNELASYVRFSMQDGSPVGSHPGIRGLSLP